MKSLKAKRDYLREWIERCKKAQDIVPSIRMNLEMTEWEIEALANRPEEAEEIPLGDLQARFDQEYDYLTRHFPMIPEYDPSAIPTLAAVTTSGSASTYVYVFRVGGLGTQEAQRYSEKYTQAYRDLQATQSRPGEIRDLIGSLGNPQTLKRFDRAFNTYFAAKSGTGERSTAAAAMRTLLDGIQGDLFQIARKWPTENMKWETMAGRLAKGPVDGTEHRELLRQNSIRGSLVSQLSTVLKDREGSSLTDLDDLWTQVLDHVYIVLRLTER